VSNRGRARIEGAKQTAPEMVKLLADRDAEVRSSAALALAKLGVEVPRE